MHCSYLYSYTFSVNTDIERLQSTQASRLQEIRFIEEEKRRIQSKIQALALVKQQQYNTVVQDNTPFVVSNRHKSYLHKLNIPIVY